MLDLDDRLDELKQLGLYRRTRMVSGPQGPRVVLDGRPVLVLCSGNSLGLADHPRVREAAADAAMRWGVGAGACRVTSGTMTLHRRLEERLARFLGADATVVFGSGSLANLGVIPALARKGEVVFHDELAHASIVDACRLAGADVFAYRHADAEHLAWGLAQADGRAALDRHRRRVRPRRRRRAARRDRPPRAPIRRTRTRRRGARARLDRAGRARRGGRSRPRRRGRRRDRLARQGARLLRRLRVLRPPHRPLPRQQRTHAAPLDRAAAGGRGGRHGGAGAARGRAATGREAARQRRGAARRARARGIRGRGRGHARRPPARRRDRARPPGSSSTRSTRACSPRPCSRPASPTAPPACGWP